MLVPWELVGILLSSQALILILPREGEKGPALLLLQAQPVPTSFLTPQQSLILLAVSAPSPLLKWATEAIWSMMQASVGKPTTLP